MNQYLVIYERGEALPEPRNFEGYVAA